MSVENIWHFMELVGYLVALGALPDMVNLCVNLVFHPRSEIDLNIL